MADDGRRARFEAAYDAHLGAVLAYARRRTGAASAEDATAEVFLVAWRRIADMPEDPLPWLLGVARNVLANQARGDRRRIALERRLTDELPSFAGAPEVADLDPALAAALRRLPGDDRELLCLLAWERLTRDQAAAALGCRPAALRLRIHRARRRLERELAAGPAARPDPAAEGGHA
ncbi:MAG: RNA polymerase sigma factor [Thermoleophilia bacterium]